MKWVVVTFLILAIPFLGAGAQELSYVNSYFWSHFVDVAVSGDYAYCAMPNGMEIIYFGDSIPALAGRIYFEGEGRGVEVRGNYAYLADGSAGFQIIDVSDPHNPVLAAHMSTVRPAVDVQLERNYAILAINGVEMIDITDPANPVFLGSYNVINDIVRLAVQNAFGYVVRDINGVDVYDLSNPARPDPIGHYTPLYTWSQDVYVMDTLMFVANEDWGTQIVDISWPRVPRMITNIPTNWYSVGVCAADSYLYVVNIWDGLETYNISDPADPMFLSVFDTPGMAWKVRAQDNYAFIVDRDYGLFRANLSDPEDPLPEGEFRTIKSVSDIQIEGSYLYLSHGDYDCGKFKILDISNIQSPQIVSDYCFYGYGDATTFDIDSNYVYVGLQEGYNCLLGIVDISDPGDPMLIGSCPALNLILDIKIEGDYAYAAAYTALEVFDISNPSNPMAIAESDSIYFANNLDVDGNYVYVAGGYDGLLVFNISDPANPIQIGSYPTDSYICGLQTRNNFMYLIDRAYLFEIFDISDPANPILLSSVDIPGGLNLYTITVSNDYAFISGVYPSGENGRVFVIDISEPESPAIVCDHHIPDGGRQVACHGEDLFVSTYSALMIYNFSTTGIADDPVVTPSAYLLSQNYPNPFNSRTTINYNLEKGSLITIDIYDILGRKMTTLLSGQQQAGAHSVIWDARDVSSGIYYYKIKADNFSETKKMIFLK